jgi:hypothetical protein
MKPLSPDAKLLERVVVSVISMINVDAKKDSTLEKINEAALVVLPLLAAVSNQSFKPVMLSLSFH